MGLGRRYLSDALTDRKRLNLELVQGVLTEMGVSWQGFFAPQGDFEPADPRSGRLETPPWALDAETGRLEDDKKGTPGRVNDALTGGMIDVLSSIRSDRRPADPAERLFAYLVCGEAQKVAGFIIKLYLDGMEVAEIVDGPVRRSMERVGELYRSEGLGICLEHRATAMVIGALTMLSANAKTSSSPTAIGGAVAGDPYFLPTLAISTTLAFADYRAQNLGPNVPLEPLSELIEEGDPEIVWLSCSTVTPGVTGAEIAAFAQRIERPVFVGGRTIDLLDLPEEHDYIVGAGSARGLLEAVDERARRGAAA